MLVSKDFHCVVEMINKFSKRNTKFVSTSNIAIMEDSVKISSKDNELFVEYYSLLNKVFIKLNATWLVSLNNNEHIDCILNTTNLTKHLKSFSGDFIEFIQEDDKVILKQKRSKSKINKETWYPDGDIDIHDTIKEYNGYYNTGFLDTSKMDQEIEILMDRFVVSERAMDIATNDVYVKKSFQDSTREHLCTLVLEMPKNRETEKFRFVSTNGQIANMFDTDRVESTLWKDNDIERDNSSYLPRFIFTNRIVELIRYYYDKLETNEVICEKRTLKSNYINSWSKEYAMTDSIDSYNYIRIGDLEIAFKNCNNTFPDIDQVSEYRFNTNTINATINPSNLKNISTRMKKFTNNTKGNANGDNTTIILKKQDNETLLFTFNDTSGNTVIEEEAPFEGVYGTELPIGLYCVYLFHYIKMVNKADNVRFKMNEPHIDNNNRFITSPITIEYKKNDDVINVLFMPKRI